MTGQQPRAGVTFDEALTRQLRQANWSRRDFLARVAAFGAMAALTQLLVACGQAGSSPSVAPATTTPTTAPSATAAAVATPTAAPTPVPEPEDELFVFNWDEYIGEDTVKAFQDKYGIKVTYTPFSDEPTQIDKIQSDGKGGGYDVTYPASTWIPPFIADGLIQKVDHTLIPNLANLSASWQNPGYDPGNAYSVPNYWWTTGYAWNPKKIKQDLTTWAELWDPALDQHLNMLSDMRECFAVGAFRLGLSPNTTDIGELDRILKLLQDQKPLLKDYTDDDIGDITGNLVWLTHCWSGDWYQMTYDAPDTKYVIPTEGSIKGNDVMVILSGAQHPVAANLWINFNLEAEVAAANTNFTGYIGPNDAALPMIDPLISEDPRLNPPQEVLDTLVELAYLQPADLAEYTDRWLTLIA
jgi:spermidine/putrescine transport system substrate-binding protein